MTRLSTCLALSAACLLGLAAEGRAQTMVYSGGALVPGYAFQREPVMSVNNSYLGYGNFTYRGTRPVAPGYVTPYGQAVNRAGVVYPQQQPYVVRPRRGLFGLRRAN